MRYPWIYICLVAVFSLTFGVIWPDFAESAQAPRLELLGQIKAGLRVPTRLDVDLVGNLYVADSRLQRVVKFDKFGRQVSSYDQVKASGAGLAVSAAGDRIYVSAFDKVAILSAAGEMLGYLGKGAGEFTAAGSIDLDSDGNIYVADLRQRKIKVYDPQGNASGSLGIASFVANSGMVIDQSTDLIYVSESATIQKAGLNPKISIYDRSGNLLRAIKANRDFGAPLHFFGGMAFDAQGRFYIGDNQGMSIRVLDSADSLLLNYNHQGRVFRPSAMAYDAVTSRLYVLQSDLQVDIYGVDGGQMPVQANSAPLAPVPVAPIGGSEVATATPTLQFNNAIDPDPQDELSYTLRVFDDARQVVTIFNVAEQQNPIGAALTARLRENRSYSWQVQAFDGQEVSPWSDLQYFYINALEEAPENPQLLAPLAGAQVRSDAVLSWQGAADKDPADSVRYAVEVAAEPEFTTLIYSQELTATALSLGEWSAALEPGGHYFWRVAAIDNHGLQAMSTEDGRFSYRASALIVTANMPGARVYLAGNHNYAGQYVGEAPLELRDLPEGRYQVVVERPGFEADLQPVDISVEHRSEVVAQLRPAKQPATLNFTELLVDGKPVNAGSLITAQIADLDLDGVEDLLLVGTDGSIQLHPGQLQNGLDLQSGLTAERQVVFTAGQPVQLPHLNGASLCLVDWNNDYRQDLLIGAADGSVRLFVNQGDFSFMAEGQWLAAVNGAAVPAVADIDLDGDKDLVVGSSDGELALFRNLGRDAQPQLSSPQLLVAFAEAAAPSFADWNADGQRDLLIAAEGQVFRAVYSSGALSSLSLVATSGAAVARVQALDIDGMSGKDLIATSPDGKLLLARAKGQDYVEAFYPALNEKLLQLQRMLADEYPVHLPLVDLMVASLAERKLTDVLLLAEELAFRLPSGAEATQAATELVATLKSSH